MVNITLFNFSDSNLKKRVRELEAENRHLEQQVKWEHGYLNEAVANNNLLCSSYAAKLEELRAELAASKARAQRYRTELIRSEGKAFVRKLEDGIEPLVRVEEVHPTDDRS